MPLMTDDLSAVVRRVGCLETLSKEKDPDAWRTVLANSLHLLESIILGLQYLEAHNMQHSDVKCTLSQWTMIILHSVLGRKLNFLS